MESATDGGLRIGEQDAFLDHVMPNSPVQSKGGQYVSFHFECRYQDVTSSLVIANVALWMHLSRQVPLSFAMRRTSSG
jgi:hypothetical protein